LDLDLLHVDIVLSSLVVGDVITTVGALQDMCDDAGRPFYVETGFVLINRVTAELVYESKSRKDAVVINGQQMLLAGNWYNREAFDFMVKADREEERMRRERQEEMY
jgi:hypothetical protein